MRTLTVTRGKGITGAGYIGIFLDDTLICKLKKKGDSFSCQISEDPHSLKAIQFSMLGTPTVGAKSALEIIAASSADCRAELYVTTELWHQSMNLSLSYGPAL